MRRLLTPACLALALFACDDHDHDDGHHHAADMGSAMSDLEVGCQHFEFGPFHPDFAAAADGELPAVMPHNHYTVAVPADGGMVEFAPHGAGMYIVMLGDAAATLSVHDASGGEVAPMMTLDPSAECPAAAQAVQFMFEAATYTLHFSGAQSVETVIHGPLGGEHMHGEGGAGGEADAGHMHEVDAGHMHEADAGHMHEADAGHMHAADAGAGGA